MLAVAIVAEPSVEPVRANHTFGATYKGTYTGGGKMRFQVSGDGSGIWSFDIYDLKCGRAFLDHLGDHWDSDPLPIENHSFDNREFATDFSYSGTFPSPGTATGTFRYHSRRADNPPVCDSGTLTWNAIGGPADMAAPGLQLAGRPSQNPLERGSVVVTAECPTEACTAAANGSVSVPGAAKVYKLRPATRRIAKGGREKLELKLSKTSRNAIGRALGRGRKLKAKVTVTAKDAAHNATTKRLGIRLKSGTD